MSLDPLTLFSALSDETRLRCVALLAGEAGLWLSAEGELCVCELTYALKVSQPKVSRHLATLRDLGIVSDRRAGLWVHYRLHPDLPAWARRILEDMLDSLGQTKPYSVDRQNLNRMPNRPAERCA